LTPEDQTEFGEQACSRCGPWLSQANFPSRDGDTRNAEAVGKGLL